MSIDPTADLLDGTEILARARGVAPVLRAEADANERLRHLTSGAVEALRSTGVFRMPMPRRWGGPEVDIVTQCEILEVLAAADGSAGWCAMIGSDAGFYSAALPDAAGRRLFPDLDAITAGWVAPGGKLHRCGDDFVLEGRWQFGSACLHADVIVGGAFVYENGEPVLGPEGRPETRVAMLPASEFEILDTWDTMGLAGSGSHDYRTEGVVVPRNQTFRFRDLGRSERVGPLYAWPGWFYANLPAVPLGIARAALETADDLLTTKFEMAENRPARQNPAVRHHLALAQARIGAARAYFYHLIGEIWSSLEAGAYPTRRQRGALAGVMPYTIQTCREAVRDLADVVGSASIRRSCPLERHVRDLTTIAQHVMGQGRWLEIAGALWLDDQTAIAAHPMAGEGLI